MVRGGRWRLRCRKHGIQVGLIVLLSSYIGSAGAAQSNTEAQLPSFIGVPLDSGDFLANMIDQPNETTKPDEGIADAARTAYESKQYITAWRLNPGGYPLLSGIDAPSASTGGVWHAKTGDPGTSRLAEWAAFPTAFLTHGKDIFTLTVGFISLDTGTPAPFTQIGGPGPPITTPTTRLGLGVAPEISWAREGPVRPFVAVGSTPFNGIVGPTIEGRLGATMQVGKTQLTPQAYRTSVTDSILSYTGIVNPSTGVGFGRVVETGGEVEIDRPITARWNFYGSASAGILRGVDVANNTHFSAQASASYDLHLPHFDSFTIGPTYLYDGYSRNLSNFTLGQGGYFSPQASHIIGISIGFQSRGGRDFVIRGNLLPGWAVNYQASSPTFPLNDDGERVPGAHQHGESVSGELAAAYRVTPRLLLGGLVRFRENPQYNDLVVGLYLRLNFSSRAALFSSDLPTAARLLGPSEGRVQTP